MLKLALRYLAVVAVTGTAFAQSTTPAPGGALGASGSTLGQPGSTLGTPATPGASTGSPTIPSTGRFNRPGDTTLPGTPTTPGLSTLPGIGERGTDSASTGATRPPLGTTGVPGPRPLPGCIPGSVTNPC